jgi:hypothetical protein
MTRAAHLAGLVLLIGIAAATSTAHADQPVPTPDPEKLGDALVTSQQLLPQNYQMPEPDAQSPYALAPAVSGPFSRIDALQGLHALLYAAMGRMPAEQLGAPLPGTAPPPGTALPPGPEQYPPG